MPVNGFERAGGGGGGKEGSLDVDANGGGAMTGEAEGILIAGNAGGSKGIESAGEGMEGGREGETRGSNEAASSINVVLFSRSVRRG
jgi:hypothetical protein